MFFNINNAPTVKAIPITRQITGFLTRLATIYITKEITATHIA